MLVGLVTGALTNINRAKAAPVIRKQADLAPAAWRVSQIAQAIEHERTAKIETAQRTPFGDVLRKLKGSTSMNQLKVLLEGPTDRPVFKSLIEQVGAVPEITFMSVGGWAALIAEPDPTTWLVGCKEAIMVLDGGGEGRHLNKRDKPYTECAKRERAKLSRLPIDFRILERYGIENYFPQQVFERLIGADLSACFPIPDDVSAIEHLSSGSKVAYLKNRNSEAAQYLQLEDLKGTDLFDIIHDISETAKRLAAE